MEEELMPDLTEFAMNTNHLMEIRNVSCDSPKSTDTDDLERFLNETNDFLMHEKHEKNNSNSKKYQYKFQRVKRPMNAFLVWSRKRRLEIGRRDPKLHNSEISKILGFEWKLMNSAERSIYREKANQLREEHRQLYPNYKYRPRRKQKLSQNFPNTNKPFNGASSTPSNNVYCINQVDQNDSYQNRIYHHLDSYQMINQTPASNQETRQKQIIDSDTSFHYSDQNLNHNYFLNSDHYHYLTTDLSYDQEVPHSNLELPPVSNFISQSLNEMSNITPVTTSSLIEDETFDFFQENENLTKVEIIENISSQMFFNCP